MLKIIKNFSRRILQSIFKKRDNIKLGFYGPPNAGKCVTPETEVVLQNGQILPIKEIFDEIKNKKNIDCDDCNEIYIDASDSNIIIPSFDINTLKIVPRKISYVYSQKYKGDILNIKTASGRKIRVTPNHPLVRVSDSGVEYVRSGNLRVGECVGIAKKIALSTALEVPQITASSFNVQNGQIQAISQFHKPKSINVPEYLNEDLISFVAYVLTESYHGKNKIVFSNTDPTILAHFDFVVDKLFKLDTIHRINKGVPQIEVYSKTLIDWLSDTLKLNPSTAGFKEIPAQLMGMPDNLTSIFLKRLFDCEGYVPKTARIRGAEIEFTSKSKKFVEQVQLLLNRFGIVGRFKDKIIKGESYYRLLIGGSDNHRLFKEKAGFDINYKSNNLDILCSAGSKRNRFFLPIVNLLEKIQKNSNLTQEQFFLDKHPARMRKDNRISYNRISMIAENTSDEIINKLANSDTLWDKIVEIKSEEYDDCVYDLTVEDTHTFLVSNGLIAHNTSLANRICKDWTGQEIGKVSGIPHETRSVQIKEKVEIKYKGKSLVFKMIDTPGIATKIDYEDFIRHGLKKKEAKKRAKEATQGIIESIKWLDDMDAVIVVIDASENPYSQVNITIIGNLVARKIPILVVANKIDLKKANIKKVESAFPEYDVVGISAKDGINMDEFYESLFRLAKKV